MAAPIASLAIKLVATTARFEKSINVAGSVVGKFEGRLKRFVKSLFKIGAPLRGLSKAVFGLAKKIEGAFKRVGRSIIALGKRFKKLGVITIGVFKRIAQGIAIAGAAFLGFSIFVGSRFEQAMAGVQGIVNATEKDFKRLEDAALELGKTTKFTATQAAEAEAEFARAGLDVDEILQALGPTLQLAIAGNLGIAQAADITAGIIRGLGKEFTETQGVLENLVRVFTGSLTTLEEVGEAFKELGPIGTAAGKSMEELSASLIVLNNSNIRAGRAGRVLRNILIRLAIQPTEVKSALESLNVSVEDSEGRFRSLADIIDDINDGFKSLTIVEQLATAGRIAGLRSVAGFTRLLAAGGDALRENEAALLAQGSVLERVARVMEDTFIGALLRLKSASEAVGIAVFKIIEPQIRPGIERLAKAFAMLEGFLRRNLERFRGLLSALRGIAVSAIGVVATILGLGAAFDILSGSGGAALKALGRGLTAMDVLLDDTTLAVDIFAAAFMVGILRIEKSFRFFFDEQLPIILKNFIELVSRAFTIAASTAEKIFVRLLSPGLKGGFAQASTELFTLGVRLFFAFGQNLTTAMALGIVGGQKEVEKLITDIIRLEIPTDAGFSIVQTAKKIAKEAAEEFEEAFSKPLLEIPKRVISQAEAEAKINLAGLVDTLQRRIDAKIAERQKQLVEVTEPTDKIIAATGRIANALKVLPLAIGPLAALERGTAEAFRAERGITDPIEKNTRDIADGVEISNDLLEKLLLEAREQIAVVGI